jgi:hypothetical protein
MIERSVPAEREPEQVQVPRAKPAAEGTATDSSPQGGAVFDKTRGPFMIPSTVQFITGMKLRELQRQRRQFRDSYRHLREQVEAAPDSVQRLRRLYDGLQASPGCSSTTPTSASC